MKEDFFIYHDFKTMLVLKLNEWLEHAYKWHDEAYIKAIRKELKGRCANTI